MGAVVAGGAVTAWRRARAAAAIHWLAVDAAATGVWLSGVAAVAVDADGVVTVSFIDNAPERLPTGWVDGRSDPRAAGLPADVEVPADIGADVVDHQAASLVTLGQTDDGDELLVPLTACGHVTVTGCPDLVADMMAAWADELACDLAVDVWAVGFDRTASIWSGGGRVRSVDAVSDALADCRGDGRGRTRVVLCAPDVPAADARRLHRLVRSRQPGVAVVSTVEAGSGWSIDVTPDRVSLLSAPQGIIRDAHRPTATPTAGVAARTPVPSPDPVTSTPPSQDTSEGASARALLDRIAVPAAIAEHSVGAEVDGLAVVRLLGSVRVDLPSGGRLPGGRTTEAVAYLACHRHGVTADQLLDVLWDGQPMDRRRLSELLSRARGGLGGPSVLPHADGGRYRLAPSVVTDVEVMAWRVAQARRHPAAIEQALSAAVALIGGRPFADVDWLWATFEGLATDAAAFACDVAVALGAWHLERRNPAAVLQAARAGMRAVPGSEQLARLRMRAYHQRGETDRIHAVIADLHAGLDDDATVDLHPATSGLYRRLTGDTPGSRRGAA